MSLKLGNVDVSKVMLGSSGVSVVYKGADEVWRVGGSAGGYGDDVFSTYVYDGTGGTRDIENGVDLAGEGGMVWIKDRSYQIDHFLFDTERGAGEAIKSNTADIEATLSESLTSFNGNGFSLGTSTSVNGNGDKVVSWTFRKSPKFFDCITYTGTGVARDIPHNLGVEPGMVIVKRTDSTSDWYAWHKNGGDYASLVNARGQFNQNDPFRVGTEFQDSLMTDSAFGLGSSNGSNSSGGEYVAYLFAHDDSDESMIKCGSYTNTATVDLGWEPQWLMVKSANGNQDWQMVDNMRGLPTGGNIHLLRANTSDAEVEDSPRVNFTSSGFEITSTNASWGSGDFIYMAIRRPNKPAEEFDPEELFATSIGQSDDPSFVGGFPVDMGIHTKPGSAGFSRSVVTRMTEKTLYTEQSVADFKGENGFDYMDGYISNQYMDASWQSWMWRRAPGFFDVVNPNNKSYQPSPNSHHHNLGVPPELIIAKCRDFDQQWYVGVQGDLTGGNYYLGALNTDGAFVSTSSGYFAWENQNEDTFYSTLFSTNEGYIHYLFASVPGISKVGSYTGNGSEVTVDCGFTNGAKWLLVKKVNEAGDWYFTCNPNNFKVLSKLNTTDPQVNYMATFNDVPSGFRVTSVSDLCDDGDEYIFYAIAAPSIGALLKKYAKGISNDS